MASNTTTAPVQLINTLHRHREAISDAYLKNGRRIDLESEVVVKALIKERLAWHLDEADGVQLASKLVALLDLSLKNDRRLKTSDNIGRLWSDLRDYLDDYKICKHEQDKDDAKSALQEAAHELIEEMQQVVKRYAFYIDRGYAQAQSIELRYKQNKRALQRAQELVTLFESCELSDFQKATGADPLLDRIFYKVLPRAIETAQKELRRTLGGLQELLNKIKEERELSGILRSIQAQFERDPGFECVTPPMIGAIPSEFNIAAPLLESAFPNVYSESQYDDLVEVASKIIPKSKTATESVELTAPEPLKDTRNMTVEVDPPDLIHDASQALIELVLDNGKTISASDAYDKLAIDADYELWLYMVVNSVNALDEGDLEQLKVNYVKVPHPKYSGNHTIIDIEIGQSAGVMA